MSVGLAQRKLIDLLDRFSELRWIEQRSLDLFAMAFKPLVGPKASAGRAAELLPDQLLLACDVLDPFRDHRVVLFLTGQGRRARFARGGLENFKLGLGDVLPVPPNPGERVVALGGAEIDEYAVRP
jgi:hypothetical protein